MNETEYSKIQILKLLFMNFMAFNLKTIGSIISKVSFFFSTYEVYSVGIQLIEFNIYSINRCI